MSIPFDSRQLKAFCVLARTGSFTQAGRELHLTQSGVSHCIKSLENDSGCRLLDRLGKKMVLTQAGEQLLHHATKILEENDRARDALTQFGKWGHGRLRVGATTTACQYIIPAVLREFKESFPNHSITIEPGDTRHLAEALLSHRIDLALSLEMVKENSLLFHPLFTDELRFIVSSLHPWAQAGKVERADIPRQNYILYDKQSITFQLIKNYFGTEKMVLNTVMEVGSMEVTKVLVKIGLGVGIFAPWIAREELEEGSLVSLPLGRRKLERRWGVSHWEGRRLSLAEETFLGLCQSACEELERFPNEVSK